MKDLIKYFIKIKKCSSKMKFSKSKETTDYEKIYGTHLSDEEHVSRIT